MCSFICFLPCAFLHFYTNFSINNIFTVQYFSFILIVNYFFFLWYSVMTCVTQTMVKDPFNILVLRFVCVCACACACTYTRTVVQKHGLALLFNPVKDIKKAHFLTALFEEFSVPFDFSLLQPGLPEEYFQKRVKNNKPPAWHTSKYLCHNGYSFHTPFLLPTGK